MIRIVFLFLMSVLPVIANGNDYWAIDIPTVEEAVNVSRERNEIFFTVSTSYEIEINDTEEIYGFYEDFFEKIGWENPMKNFSRSRNEHQGKWNSYRSAFNQDNLPESSYASVWKAKKIPAIGTVNLTLTGFKDGKYNAKVSVSLAPEVDTSPLFKLQKLMAGNPRNIFILYEATGGNPFEIDKVNSLPAKGYENNEMVKEYYKVVETIIKQYRDFGMKYIKR